MFFLDCPIAPVPFVQHVRPGNVRLVRQQPTGEARPDAHRARRAPAHPGRHEVRVPARVRRVRVPRQRGLPQMRQMGRYVPHL